MAANSNIEWTQATWNPIAGCTPVSPGCLHCYAAVMANRLEAIGQSKYAGLTVLHNGIRTFNGKINLCESELSIPLKRKKPTMYFVNSMSDLFHKDVPFEFIDKVFAVMALCPQHTFQVLTKRPERMKDYLEHLQKAADSWAAFTVSKRFTAAVLNIRWLSATKRGGDKSGWHAGGPSIPNETPWPLPNVWLGTSVENQKAADERIPHLLKCPAAVLFLSCEPLLGPVDLKRFIPFTPAEWSKIDPNWKDSYRFIDWVIIGGESGGGARTCDVDWIRSIVAQCKAAKIPCFVKQLGAKPVATIDEITGGDDDDKDNIDDLELKDKKGGDIEEWPFDLQVRQFPETSNV